jgi:hypothetical protein
MINNLLAILAYIALVWVLYLIAEVGTGGAPKFPWDKNE